MPVNSPAITAAKAGASSSGPLTIAGIKLFGDDGFNFRDVLDLINPIQHIPVVGSIYRKLTGDVAAPAIRVAGGALFGGPLGAAFAAASVAFERIMRPVLAPGGSTSSGDVTAVASAAPTEARGGWMVAQQRAFPLPAASGKDLAGGAAVARVGPLEIGKAYGLGEIEAERRHLFGSFHLQA